MRNRRLTGAAWLATCTLVIVIGLAIAVAVHPGPLPGEVAAVRRWQRFGEPVPTFAEWVRLTTSTESTIAIAAIPALWAIRRYGRSGTLAVVIVAGTMLVAQPVVKEVIDRPRPTEAQVEVRAPYTSKSFPSGHSMSTTAAWGTAAFVAARRGRPSLAVALCVPVAVTAVASQVQGVHWPSDALAGTLLGAVAAGVAASALLRAEERTQERPAPSG